MGERKNECLKQMIDKSKPKSNVQWLEVRKKKFDFY